MMKWLVVSAIGAALALWPSDGAASTFFQETLRCPVGGKEFTATLQGSSSSFGQRPDGRPYSTGLAPPPECPGNGFVFYKDKFTADEAAKLTPLVNGAEYQALRGTENVYYRLYWLLQHMGAKADEVAQAVLVASWNSDDEPERKARYQREFVALAATLPADTKDLFWYQARAADLLRELGDHAGSNALLSVMEPRIAAFPSSEARENWTLFVSSLRVLNAEGNRLAEPVTMVPPQVAASICVDTKRPLTGSERERCASASLKEPIASYRAMRERMSELPR